MPSAPHATCPRCAYDLSGLCAAWHPHGECVDGASCPTTGVCSECGLVFEWRHIFRPELAGLAWFIESPRPPRGQWPWLRTTLRALRPWGFWRHVTVETPIGWSGTVKWVGWWFVLALAAPALTWPILKCIEVEYELLTRGTVMTVWPVGGPTEPFAVGLFALYQCMSDVIRLAIHTTSIGRLPAWISVGVAAGTAFPVVFLLLPFTRRASKVRAALVWRATAYSCVWALPLTAWIIAWQVSLVLYQEISLAAQVGWTPQGPPTVLVLLMDILKPIANHSPLVWGGWWRPSRVPIWFAAPVVMWISVFWLFAMKRSWRMRDWWAAWLACASVALVAAALALLSNPDFLLRML